MSTTVNVPNTNIEGLVAAAVIEANTQAQADEYTRLKLENEMLRLQAENAALKAKSPQINPAAAPHKPREPRPAVEPVTVKGYTPADLKLLAIVERFVTPADKTKAKIPGTFAVKVHSYLKSAGIPEEKVREICQSAIDRKVLSCMSIPTKNGPRMMIYFDYRKRPVDMGKNSATAEESAELKNLFA